VADEADRTRLIGEISRVIREPATPESTRCAGLTLIGWLARRMPGEKAHALGVDEARESERRLVSVKNGPCDAPGEAQGRPEPRLSGAVSQASVRSVARRRPR